jgi:polar amino acid transport system substrate-binding protein
MVLMNRSCGTGPFNKAESKMKVMGILLSIFILAQPTLAVAGPQAETGVPHGQRLRVAVTDDPPYTMKTEDGKWTGFLVDLWSQVAREHEWNYELLEMPLENIIQALHQGTIDLTIASLFQTPERERLLDFSAPLGSTHIALATLPNKIEHPLWSALRIFISWSTLKVIAFLLFLLFATGLIFWLIERKKNPEHFGGGVIKGISSGIYWVGSTLASGVCYGIALKSLAGRLVGLFWMFVCAIVLSAFIASLTSSLTLRKLVTPVIDLKTLRTMHLGTVKGSVPAAFLHKKNINCELYTEERDALEALTKKQIDGFLYDEVTLNYFASGDRGQHLSVYPTKTKHIYYAFAMPKWSPLRKEINASLLSIMHEPYWDFLSDYYGLTEYHGENPLMGRRWGK